MTETLELFTSALNDMSDEPARTSYQDLTSRLLRRLAEKGLTLEQCSDRRMLARSPATLKAYCRKFEIAFPDYTPRAMLKKEQEEAEDA